MKICFFIDFFLPHYYGGGQMRLYELTKRLLKKGHEITIVTMQHKGVPIDEVYEGLSIHHIGPVIQQPPQRTLKELVVFFFAIKKWLKQHEYNVICAEGVSLFPCFLFAGKTPVVATIHDVSTGAKDQWFGLGTVSRLGERIALKLPYQKIVTVSGAVKQELVAHYRVAQENIVVIPNAVDDEKLASIPASAMPKKSIVFVGRFIPHKHIGDLVRAFAQVQKEESLATLFLFGSGPEEKNIRELVKKLKLEKTVRFFINAPTREVIGMLKRSRLLVLPSTREGFGITLAEAGALSIPVIAYDIPAVREVVLQNKTGILVPPRDVEKLTGAILSLLKNQKKAEMLGKAAQKYICSAYRWDRSAQLFEALLLELQQEAQDKTKQ